MNAKDRARQRLTSQTQVASGPVETQDEDVTPIQDRKAAARARLQNNAPINAAVNDAAADDMVHLPEDTAGRDTVPEATDVDAPVPMTQGDLFSYYREKQPELFDEQGNLTDYEKAAELGIVTKASLVPSDSPLDAIQPHASTKSVSAGPYKYVYNEPEQAVEVVQQQAESARLAELSRTERGAEKRAEREQYLEDEAADFGMDTDEFVEAVLIPSMDKEESPYLSAFFNASNSIGLGSFMYNRMTDVGNAAEWTGEAFTDGVETLAEQMQETAPDVYDGMVFGLTGSKQDPATFAKGAGREVMNFLTFTESIPLLGIAGGTKRLATRTQRASMSAADDLRAAIAKHADAPDKAAEIAASKEIVTAKKRLNQSVSKEIAAADATQARAAAKAAAAKPELDIRKARIATSEEIAAKTEEARRIAEQNSEIASELIDAFESTTGKVISREGAKGQKVIDFDKARQAGVETAEEIAEAQRGSVRQILTGDADVDLNAAAVAGQLDTITSPLLKPEKFDGLVAAAADLKKQFPDAFKPKKHPNGKDYTVIDHLFDLTVRQDLKGNPVLQGSELLDMLNKYNISFEDYILTVVGSGSEAGKILNKLSQIKRLRPANEMIALQEKATVNAQGAIRKGVMRLENIRRGGLVSQIATAARNLSSGGIRAPMEGLGNVMDTALYNLSEEGAGAAAKSLLSSSNWRDSFRHMKYMFDPRAIGQTRQYVDFIIDRPELAGQFDLMFNNINEIQRLTGRGEAVTKVGKGLDFVATKLEDGVDLLNTPNRWQEHLIRRGAFLGELERLVKREYGIDLIETINAGKIRDLLNDAGSVRPKDARSFLNLVEDATQKALDVTYAKQPDIPVFRSTSQFIVRNGLTVVMPFPRFMFNSMELMGQYAAGASIPLTRKVASVVTRGRIGGAKLSAKDRQRISRNIVGMGGLPFIIMDEPDKENENALDYAADFLMSMSAVGAAYQYRTSEDAPSDYKLLKTGDDTVMDTTPQYPLRQFMYLGEVMRRFKEGTFSDWFKAKEFTETFLGTNIREGVGQSLVQEVADLATGVDLADEEQAARLLGRTLGNYAATWMVPFSQVIEAQRATGERGLLYKDTAEDPTMDFQGTFMREISRPFARFMSPEEEAALPKREFLFAEEKRRVAPLFRVLGGINLATVDDEYGEYIGQFGYTDFELGSKSKVPSIRRFENQVVRDALPGIVDRAKKYEQSLRGQYQIASDKVKEEFTEEQYVSSRVRALIKKQIQKVRTKISKGKVLTADAPVYAENMLKYRRLTKETRVAAGVRFVEQYDREPDPTNEKDIARLVMIGKAYDKSLK